MDQVTEGNAQGKIRLANIERIMKAAEKVFAELTSAQTPDLAHDGSTNQLITFYRKARRRL